MKHFVAGSGPGEGMASGAVRGRESTRRFNKEHQTLARSKSDQIPRRAVGRRACPLNVALALLILVGVQIASNGSAWAQGALTNGGNHEGTITTNNLQDTWTFTATNGDSVILRVGTVTTTNYFAPYIQVYGPGSVLIAAGAVAGDAVEEVAFSATNNGTFTVLVSDGNYGGSVGTGTYELHYLKVPGAFIVPGGDEGGAMTNGGNYDGVITSGDLDAWTFTANAGESVLLRVGLLGSTNYFAPWIRLYGPDGSLISQGSVAGDTAEEIAVTPTNSGTFTVVVADGNYGDFTGTGTYELHYLKVPGAFVVPGGDEGGAMTNGGNYDGTILTGDLDAWTFTANSGESVLLRVGSLSTTNYFAPWIRLYGPDGALISQGAVAGDDVEEIAVTTTNSGTFTVVVADGNYGDIVGTGTYELHYLKFPGALIVPAGDEGGPMVSGGNYDGTILPGDLDPWTFTASAGDSVLLRVGQLSTTNYFSPWIRLYGPDGVLISQGAVAGDAVEEIAITATNSGTFTVVVADGNYGDIVGTGTYELHYLNFPGAFIVPAGDDGGPMASGGNYDGTILPGDLDPWTFTASAGDNVLLRVGQLGTTNYFNPWIRLYGPDGVLISQGAVAGDLAEEIAITATNSGTFTVVVADGNYSDIVGSGTYELHYLKTTGAFTVPSGDEGGAMLDGGAYAGTILSGDLDPWTFTANQGETVVLRLGELGSTNYFDPWLRLYGPDGVLISQGAVAGSVDAQLSVTVTNSGTFMVIVSDGNYGGYGGTGPYALYYFKDPGSYIIPTGDEGGLMTGVGPYSGSISIADLDPYTFTACQGDNIGLRLYTTNFQGNLALYGMNGALLSSVGGGTSVFLNYRATNCGPFTVVVSSATSGGSGTYQISGNVLESLRLCAPLIVGTNSSLSGIGGTSNTTFVLYTTTNAATSLALWTPFYTNVFDQNGVFTITNVYNPATPQQYFRYKLP